MKNQPWTFHIIGCIIDFHSVIFLTPKNICKLSTFEGEWCERTFIWHQFGTKIDIGVKCSVLATFNVQQVWKYIPHTVLLKISRCNLGSDYNMFMSVTWHWLRSKKISFCQILVWSSNYAQESVGNNLQPRGTLLGILQLIVRYWLLY